MLRGTNLGNWLVREGYMFHFDDGPQSTREIEALTNELLGPDAARKFWHDYMDRYVTRDDIQFIKQAGFNSIRIPLHYKYFLPGDDEGFALLDRVIGWSREAGLYVILDMHCAPGGQTGTNIDDSWGYPWIYDDPQAQQLTVEIWKRIAAHYRDSTTVLGYDLLNEPIPHYPQLQVYNKNLEPLYRKIVAGVREVDPNHVVILGGAQWDTNFAVFGPPFDKNVMYNLHKYWMPSGKRRRPTLHRFSRALSRSTLDERVGRKHRCMGRPIRAGTRAKPDRLGILAVQEDGRYLFASLLQPSDLLGRNRGLRQTPRRHRCKPRSASLKRPPQAHITAAFNDLLDKIELRNCRTNDGYLKALGMTPPR